jgi:hypothetical protein
MRKSPKRRFRDLRIDGKIIFKRILNKYGVNWIYLAQDRDQWRTLMKNGNEPSGSKKSGEFLN